MPNKTNKTVEKRVEEFIEDSSLGWANDTMTRKEFKISLTNFITQTQKETEERVRGEVELIEIWQPVETGGEMVGLEKGNLKRIAMLANNRPLFLEKDYYVEIGKISKEDLKRLKTLNNKDE